MKRTFLRALCLLCALLMLGALTLTGCGETAENKTAAETNPSETAPTDTETPTEPEPVKEGHDHDQPSMMSLNYQDNEDGTVSIVIKDCEGNLLLDTPVYSKSPLVEYPTENLLCLSWVTDSHNPEGYECLYVNRLTCQVSGIIKGVQQHDNQRIVYTQVKDDTLNVIVRDLFGTKGFYKEIPLEDAYVGGESTAKGAVKIMDGDTMTGVRIAYYKDKDGKEGLYVASLVDEDEAKTSTDKTDEK